MIKTYFIRNTISKLLIYSVHSLGSLERTSDENKMILEVKEVSGSSDPALQSTVEEAEAGRGQGTYSRSHC